jgi:hypothetical protein
MAYTGTANVPSAEQAVGRNTNSIMQGFIDRGPWYYYDTVIQTPVAGTAQLLSQYSPYSIPIGAQNPSTGVANTKLITNMRAPNQFPPPRCLLLMSIGFYFSSRMIKSDIDLVLDSCYFEFRIDDKVFHEGHLYEYAACTGLSGVTTQNTESVYTNGAPIISLGKRFEDWAKYIAPLQQFTMTLFFSGNPNLGTTNPPLLTGPAGLYMMVKLDGLTDRSVQ